MEVIMKRMIYQVYVGKPSKLYDTCVESVANYCKAHGIDHIVQRTPILKIKPDVFSTNRSKESYEKHGGFLPIFEKENALDYFDRYDQICIVDADIFIRPDSPNIFDELNPNVDFAGVIEREMPIQDWYKQKIIGYSKMQYQLLHPNPDFDPNKLGYEFYNMGLMLMNKSITKHLKGQSARDFITRSEFKDFVDGQGPWKWSTDQTLLNYWVRKSKMKQQHLDWKWNALYTAVKEPKKAHFVHFFLKDKLPNKGENVEQLLKDVL
jgi:hypothetical protein